MRGVRAACAALFGLCCGGLPGLVTAGAASIRFEGGDGTSSRTAVVILGAPDEQAGIAAERDWTARAHPTWRKANQALLEVGGRSYDRIDYDAPDGLHVIWFDITDFFGKF